MSRARNKNIAYAIEVVTPNGEQRRINNWLFYPDTPRRNFANNFNIIKYEII